MMKISMLFFLALAIPSMLKAALPDPPPMNNRPVVDAANIIPDDAEAALTQKLLSIKQRSNHEVAVLTVPSLEGYSIDEYGLNAARKYGLGSADGDDGVLITIAPNDHEARIDVGRGLTGMLTDMTSTGIVKQDMIPYFRGEDWVGGINVGVDKIADVIVPLTPEQLLVKQREASEALSRQRARLAAIKDGIGNVAMLGGGLGGLIGLGFLVTAPARRRRREEEEAERQRLHEAWLAEEAKRETARREERARQEAERLRSLERQRVKAAAEKAKHDAWYASLSPQERTAYDAELKRKRDEAAKVAAADEARRREREEREERERERRRRDDDSSSSYGGGYSSGSSSSSSSDFGGSFGGGGGSFDGGGGSGSW
jgi:uncharacterized membrane protein YgcG